MTLPIRRLQEKTPVDEDAIRRFLDDHSFPLREGTTSTFVYHGEADEVLLKHLIYGLPAAQPFERLEGTDLWHIALEIPVKSRIEYKIEVACDGKRKLILDPLNSVVAHDPYGVNSVCHGLGYEVPDWTAPDPETRPGSIVERTVRSEAFGDEREVKVYLPARLRPSGRYPLLIVHDGDDYVEYASFKVVLDNLIERLEIPPMIVALTHSENRLDEYAADRRHSRFLAEELLPALAEEFPVAPGPASRGLMGASFGGVASLAAAWHFPGTWGRLLTQSASFAFTDIGEDHQRGPAFDPVVKFMNAFRDNPVRPVERFFLSCGIYESLIYENRSILPLLQATGMNVKYVESRDGHNWECWRDRLREGLSWLFPGPLWMVYE